MKTKLALAFFLILVIAVACKTQVKQPTPPPLTTAQQPKIHIITPDSPITITTYFTDTVFTITAGPEPAQIDMEPGVKATLTNNSDSTMYIIIDGVLTESDFNCLSSGSKQSLSNLDGTWQQITIDPTCQITLQNDSEEIVSLTVQILEQ